MFWSYKFEDFSEVEVVVPAHELKVNVDKNWILGIKKGRVKAGELI